MQKILAKFERKYGRYAPANLTYYLIGIQGIVFFFELIEPGFQRMLFLDTQLIQQGEFWRLFTWIFIPPSKSPIFFIFALYWLYNMGTQLEAHWGAFSYLLYWLVGYLGTTFFAYFLSLSVDNTYILLSLFLAFATLWPDYQLLLFFIFPVKIKWLALIGFLSFIGLIGTMPGFYKLVPLVALANYFLFFTPQLIALIKNFSKQGSHAGVRYQFRKKQEVPVLNLVRRCNACEVTNEDFSQEFRICNCEKCGADGKEFCLKHVWEH